MLWNAHLLIAVQLPCCSRVYALSFTSSDRAISTHLNLTSHSKYMLARSWSLYSCCPHFQLGTTNHLSWSELISGHGLERTLLSLLDNPQYEHWSLPHSFLFSLSTTFDTANELWTAYKRGWLFWNSLFQESHKQRWTVEKNVPSGSLFLQTYLKYTKNERTRKKSWSSLKTLCRLPQYLSSWIKSRKWKQKLWKR